MVSGPYLASNAQGLLMCLGDNMWCQRLNIEHRTYRVSVLIFYYIFCTDGEALKLFHKGLTIENKPHSRSLWDCHVLQVIKIMLGIL